MVICSRPQRVRVDGREMNDTSHDLHDIVTLATLVPQLEKGPFAATIRELEASVVFIMLRAQRNILWVSVCVHVFIRVGGGGALQYCQHSACKPFSL